MLKILKRPGYQKIAEELHERIRRGVYLHGQFLPPERKLADEFGVSSIVINQALKLLASHNVIEKIPRRGSVVKEAGKVTTEKLRPAELPDAAELENLFSEVGVNTRPKELRIGVYAELPIYKNFWEQTSRRFNKLHPDIELKLRPINNIKELLLREDDECDILQIPGVFLPYFINNNRLFSPAEIGGIEIAEKDYYAGALNGAEFNGEIWGVPLATSVLCQYCAKDHLEWLGPCFETDNWWDWLASLETAMSNHDAPGSAVLSGLHLLLYAALAGVGGAGPASFDDLMDFASPVYTDFLKRFEPFFQNPRLFKRHAKTVSQMLPGWFDKMDSAIILGSSSWITCLSPEQREQIFIASLPTAPGGFLQANSNLIVIGRNTPYPFEGLEFLNFMAGNATQAEFAREERLTANRCANRELKISGFEEQSCDNMIVNLSKSDYLSTTNPGFQDFIMMVLNHETLKWQLGHYDYAKFQQVLTRKTKFFLKNHRINSARNGD